MIKWKVKFNFFTEALFIIFSVLFRIISSISWGGIDYISLIIFLSQACLLFLFFVFFGINNEKGWIFSIAFIIKFICDVTDFSILKYFPQLSITYICGTLASVIFILYGFNRIQNKVYAYIATAFILIDFISMRLAFSYSYMSSLMELQVNSFDILKGVWSQIIAPIMPYCLLHLAVLIYFIPTKSKKDIENKSQISKCLRVLKEEYEKHLITEDEYLSKKKEYINKL